MSKLKAVTVADDKIGGTQKNMDIWCMKVLTT